jgi:L-alanine-DL-glutamate epimerase-like enolase superfamily enzyme
MGKRSLTVKTELLRLTAPFRISGYVFEHQDVLVVTIREDVHAGRGEASGVYYSGDNIAHMIAAAESVRGAIEAGASRAELQSLLPPGGARNALDCALWELEAARAGQPVWALAGLEPPRPLLTTLTLGADDPARVAENAHKLDQARALKLKLTGEIEADLGRIEAVRSVRPDVWLGVDANQGYRREDLDLLVEALVASDVSLLEQPLARGREADLEGYGSPIPIAADESALSLADVPGLAGRFDVVNIKLDKCGGLTEALAMAAEARRLGLKVMVGNMVGTSLAMAPAYLIGQLCDFVDLDGPVFLTEDRVPAVVYRDGYIACGEDVWGGGGRLAA